MSNHVMLPGYILAKQVYELSYLNGIQEKITETNKLSADFIENGDTNKVVTSTDIANWNDKVSKAELSAQSYLVSETDPVFSASAASTISSSDISNWNAKTSNIGTITGITMNGSSKGTSGIVDLGTVITSLSGMASEQYVDTAVAQIVNSAPETLDTLNELATALGNDPNFATTVATQIGNRVTKQDLSMQSYVTTDMLSDQGYIISIPDNYITQDQLSANSYLMSFEETDPTVPSYVKAITENNISYWNSKISNVKPDWLENDEEENSYIFNKPPVGNSKIFYGVCDTAAATSIKVVDCQDFTEEDLVNGVIMMVKFSVTNSAAVAGLNLKINEINSSQKPIKKMYASTSSNAAITNLSQVKEITAGAVMLFIYTGSYWMVAGLDMNVNSTYSALTLADGKAGTATTSRAITASVLKQLITYFIEENATWVYEEGTGSLTRLLPDDSIGIASGAYALSEGYKTEASGAYSHAESYFTEASGDYSHAESYFTEASGDYSHAEGNSTVASGLCSHAEGNDTIASGNYSHAEGDSTEASYPCSHAEGEGTAASGGHSHAEGEGAEASGNCSHAEGYFTEASGEYSHAEGFKTETFNLGEHASGFFNVSHQNNENPSGRTLFSVGNGDIIESEFRSNAFEIMENGDMYIYGVNDYDGQTISELKTLQYFLDVTPLTSTDYDIIFLENDLQTAHLIIDRFPESMADEFNANFGNFENYIHKIIVDTDYGEISPGYYDTHNSGSNVFEFSGQTMEIDDVEYLIWILLPVIDNTIIIAITEKTLTLEDCIANSMAVNINNRWSPFTAVMHDDDEYDQDLNDEYTLVYVKLYDYSYYEFDFNNIDVLSLSLYIDSFEIGLNLTEHNKYYDDYATYGFVNFRDYINYYNENWCDTEHSTECIYANQTIEIENESYYLWECTNDNNYVFYGAMRTGMTSQDLFNKSKLKNPFCSWCPFEYILDEDKNIIYQDKNKNTKYSLVTIKL